MQTAVPAAPRTNDNIIDCNIDIYIGKVRLDFFNYYIYLYLW